MKFTHNYLFVSDCSVFIPGDGLAVLLSPMTGQPFNNDGASPETTTQNYPVTPGSERESAAGPSVLDCSISVSWVSATRFSISWVSISVVRVSWVSISWVSSSLALVGGQVWAAQAKLKGVPPDLRTSVTGRPSLQKGATPPPVSRQQRLPAQDFSLVSRANDKQEDEAP